MNKNMYLHPAFIESLMRGFQPQKNIRVLAVEPLEVDNSASILAVLTAGRSEKAIGHFGIAVTVEEDGAVHTHRMVLKVKPNGSEIVDMLAGLSQLCSAEVAEVYGQKKSLTGFQHTHMRELEVYGKMCSALMPRIFGIQADPAEDSYIILMEYLEDVELLNSVMEPEKWTDAHIKQALIQIAAWHATYLDKFPAVDVVYWDDAPSAAYMLDMKAVWEVLLQSASTKFPDLYTSERTALLATAIEQLPAYWQELEAMPKTFVHNDLNPRNTCFKMADGKLSFCVYDWELSTWHVPQYDVVELLSFVLDEDRYHLREYYLEFYRKELHDLTGQFKDKQTFKRGFDLAALDFGMHRLGMYMMAHAVSPYPFLPRVVKSYFNTLEQAGNYTASDLLNKAYLADS